MVKIISSELNTLKKKTDKLEEIINYRQCGGKDKMVNQICVSSKQPQKKYKNRISKELCKRLIFYYCDECFKPQSDNEINTILWVLKFG